VGILSEIDDYIRSKRSRKGKRTPSWFISTHTAQDPLDNADMFLIGWEPLKSYKNISHGDSLLYYGDVEIPKWKPMRLPMSPKRVDLYREKV
jgi:hypothetical protein